MDNTDKSTDTHIQTEPVLEMTCAKCGAEVDISEVESFAHFDCPQCGDALTAPAQFGNFRLLRVLGSGGMGSVFLAEDITLGRRVALKVMLRALGENPEFVDNFKREAQAAAKLNHSHIAQIYAFGQHAGQPYIVMELISGKRFDDMVDADDPLSPAFVMKVGADIAEGLQAAAEIGLVHGDIKPDNILFDEQFTAKLVDFGIAGMSNEKSEEIWGTPYYIAPEKVRRQRIDLRTDIYSLGATLYHAIAGRPPFEGETAIDVVKARFQADPLPLEEVREDADPLVSRIIARMLQLDPGMRYPTYKSLLSDMRAYLESVGGAELAVGSVAGSGKKMMIRKKGQSAGGAPGAAGRNKGLIVQRGSLSDSSRLSRGSTTGTFDAYAAKPVAGTPKLAGRKPAKPDRRKRWVWWVLILLLAVGAGFGGVFLARRKLSEDPAEPSAPTTSDRLAATAQQAARALEAALQPLDARLSAARDQRQSLMNAASNRIDRVWGASAWADAVRTLDARREARQAPEPPATAEAQTTAGAETNGVAQAAAATNAPAAAVETEAPPAAVDPATLFLGRAVEIHAAAPPVWSAIETFWQAADTAQTTIQEAEALQDQLLAADPVDMDLEVLQAGMQAPETTDLGRLVRRVQSVESNLTEMRTASESLERRVASFQTQQRHEAEARARAEAEAREQAERERLAVELRERVENECRRVRELEAEQADHLQARRYREARWAMRDLHDRLTTDEGRAAAQVAKDRMRRIESLNTFLAEQVRDHGAYGINFGGGRFEDLQAEDVRTLQVRGQAVPWTDVGLTPTVGLIQYFLMDDEQAQRIRLRERVDQSINAAIYSLYYGRENPHAEQLARTLARQALQLFPGAESTIQQLLPEFQD